ncbi:aa3-type cytochrome oxidase subunit I [Paractinoplanes maris]|uniref:aa3-type cytochrome oxidase subunit I n=1 Tax=Paractinoplanes maris TaxID=1734446 RepID=UPI002021616F|nr:cytochrome c oxidase subunit I [Actinoplanes maris]
MTALSPRPVVTRPAPVRRQVKGSALARLLRTTDAKQIGIMYMVTAFVFFVVGGFMALLIRGELARPGLQFLSPEQYNQLFTMHGTIMLLFFATPIVFAFANYVVPIQIGAPDVAFPRLNSFAFWLFFFGGLIALSSFLTPGGAADFGWTAYTPLSDYVHSPGPGGNMWIIGLALSGLGTILGGVNMITTILTLRAPGMTMFRMPIFTWNILITSLLVVLVFPFLAAALFALAADRVLGAHVFDTETGGPMLWQHLFWFFGHPEVYVVALPFFGIITEVIPVFSRKPVFGYKGLVAATLLIAGLSMSVWAHHMFATGQVLLPFFSFLSYLIAVPTGMKFFVWIGTMWRGQIVLDTAMLFAIGFLVTFLLGGLTGVLLASPPIDFHVHDSYFVVAHFHYVLFGTIVFAVFAGIYFWFPKMTGRLLDERSGKIHFWLTFLGFHATFLVQHWLGAEGMPRRYADYLATDGFTTLHTISTVGSFVLGVSILPFVYNVWKSYRVGQVVTVDDPWGFGNSLEWATSCPPPLRNFDKMPRIRSERPAFDAKYGDAVSDLGRELRAGDARVIQTVADEVRPDHGPDASDVATPGGATGSEAARDYQPDPASGARGVRVPEPEDIRRPGAADQPGGASLDAEATRRDSTDKDRRGDQK